MPKYRFQWANLPETRLRALCRDLGLTTRDPAEELRAHYGARPDDLFVQAAWPHLRDDWLAHDAGLRERVVADLWALGLGGGQFPSSRATEMDYLAGRNSTARLRAAVLAAFVEAGETPAAEDIADAPTAAAPGTTTPTSTAPPVRQSPAATPTAPGPFGSGSQGKAASSLGDLERRLWDAANALRGPVDPADFKTYVFPMLFYKWISDSWDVAHATATAEFGVDVVPEVEADYHQFTLPPGTHWRDVTTKTDNVGSRIATALGKIEQANAATLAGIFGDAAWGNKDRLPESSLVALIDAFTGLALDPGNVSHDVLGQAYEYLLKNFADESGKKAGEFFTPRQVVRLLVRLLDPQPGESIYDPACGSGGMLVETINALRAKGEDSHTLRLYGQEVNLTTAAIAKMNLFLHEIEDFKIVRGDTLRSPGLRQPDGAISQFDIVIANPPFSLANWGADTWAADPRSFCGVPPTKNGDFAWVQHMIASMSGATGRVGVVMPHGVLFRGGAEARIRQCLIESDQLEAVVGLPGNLFYSTTIPACVLVFRAAKPVARRNHVLFVDGSQRFTKGRNQNQISHGDVDAVVSAYQSGSDPDGGVNVRLVTFDEIKANGFDLNIGRYLKTAVVDALDLSTALANYDEARARRVRSETSLFERLSAAGITDLGDADG